MIRSFARMLFAFVALWSVTNASGPGPLPDEIRVVATIPDLANIAEEIGGTRVSVRSLAKGTMNIHRVPVQPSMLVAMNRADLFLEMGLSLEHAFVPGLLMRARNPRIQPGQPGFVNCSVGWEAIHVPEKINRSQSADVHPEGNPHFNLDPRAGHHMAKHVLAGLIAVDPDGREYYEERHAAYAKRLDEARARWSELGKRLEGMKVVSYHEEFEYFALQYGIEVVGTIESKPGIDPSPSHLAKIIQLVKDEGVRVLLEASSSSRKSTRFVADKTGARVLGVPVLVGGEKNVSDWISMMDRLHERLVKAREEEG